MRLGLALPLPLLVLLGAARPSFADAPASPPAPPAQPAGEAPTPPAPDASAEEPWSLDLTVGDAGLGIGNSKRIIGVRLNDRDRAPYVVYGLNATVWSPPSNTRSGTVNGILLGLPLAEAAELRGLGLGLGVGADGSFDGIGVGLVGVGSGRRLRGIHAAGIGVGTGGSIDGLAVGLVGVGAGGGVRGVAIGGVGAGTGGDVTGAVIGGLGAGAGGRLRGLALGGLGVGVGGDVTGILAGGLGAGAGGRVRGLVFAGLGAGAGEAIEGVALSLGGVAAPAVRGLAAAPAVGGREVTGLVLAPAYFHVEGDGIFTGVAVSAWNRVLGEQRGLTIGIFNYAAALHGVQVGLLNYAGNNPAGLKLLPLANAHR